MPLLELEDPFLMQGYPAKLLDHCYRKASAITTQTARKIRDKQMMTKRIDSSSSLIITWETRHCPPLWIPIGTFWAEVMPLTSLLTTSPSSVTTAYTICETFRCQPRLRDQHQNLEFRHHVVNLSTNVGPVTVLIAQNSTRLGSSKATAMVEFTIARAMSHARAPHIILVSLAWQSMSWTSFVHRPKLHLLMTWGSKLSTIGSTLLGPIWC